MSRLSIGLKKDNKMNFTVIENLTDFPRYVSIETYSACNSKCTFCPHPLLDKNRSPKRMSDIVFEKIIKECSIYDDLQMITLSFQNEPLMDQTLFDKISYVRNVTREKPKICIVTNGSLLTSVRLNKLLQNPPDILKISVYGIDKETYEKTMIGLNFEKTINNIRNLIALTQNMEKPKIQINVVYTDEIDKTGIQKISQYWMEKGLKPHFMNVENRAGTLMNKKQTFSNNKWRVRTWCQRPMKQLSIFPNGDVVLCCADWKREVILGNVSNKTLREIWFGNTINHYRSKLNKGEIKDLNPCNKCMQADAVINGQDIIEFAKLDLEK